MDALDKTIKPVLVHWRIPALIYLRLMWLVHLEGAPVENVAARALNAGLCELEVPDSLDTLLDEQGELRVPKLQEGDNA